MKARFFNLHFLFIAVKRVRSLHATTLHGCRSLHRCRRYHGKQYLRPFTGIQLSMSNMYRFFLQPVYLCPHLYTFFGLFWEVFLKVSRDCLRSIYNRFPFCTFRYSDVHYSVFNRGDHFRLFLPGLKYPLTYMLFFGHFFRVFALFWFLLFHLSSLTPSLKYFFRAFF